MVSGSPDPSAVISWVCQQCPFRREMSILRAERGYWQRMYQRAKGREELLRENIKELEAKLKLREQQLFGRKTEQSKGGSEQHVADNSPARKRGQQPGTKGHGRRGHEQLAIKEEFHELPAEEQCCPRCGLPYVLFPGTEDSDMVEVQVKAHVRRIRRKRYMPTCSCAELPVIITAPSPAKLIPKGAYGDSVWIQVLLDKFLFYRPTFRLLESLKLLGVEISQGTITGGLKRLASLFKPVYHVCVGKSQQEQHWHADETRWLVFEEVEGKVGYRWYVWVFKSVSTVVYILDQSRSSSVPKTHLKHVRDSLLSVDRYSAYKSLAKEKDGSLRLSYCWSHVRRDFLSLAKTRSDQEIWAMEWVEQINLVYHINNQRVDVGEDSHAFAEADKQLREALESMEIQRDKQLADKDLLLVQRKLLTSLKEHWEGLLIFVDHPEIPMDNNPAERALRGPIVGRKNFYGSGAQWSGKLAVMMFSLFQTLLLWQVNPKTWLERFFRACAEHGGTALDDVSVFLPWNMSVEELDLYRRAPPLEEKV
jgi:transposase